MNNYWRRLSYLTATGVSSATVLSLRSSNADASDSMPHLRPGSLDDSTVMIFGGSSGIGLATAKEAARLGAERIYIVGRNQDKLDAAKAAIEAVNRPTRKAVTIITKSCDAADEVMVQELMRSIPDRSIDHLVTTPGGSMKLGNLVANKRTCADVRKQLDMKLFAQLGPVLAATEKIRDHGSITMVSGVLSRRMGRGNDALAISNGAIEVAVKCLANDHGFDGRKIRVNCLSPGMTMTGVYGTSAWAQTYQAKAAASVPLQRNGLPEELAHAIVFLQTNTFVTGVVIDVDGGNVIKP